MTWADFYLVCFVAGFFLSVMMFLGGWPAFPHFHIHHARLARSRLLDMALQGGAHGAGMARHGFRLSI